MRRSIIMMLMLTILLFSVTVLAVLYSSRYIVNKGNIKTIGINVYWDAECTNKMTEINWGILDPGWIGNVTGYLKNEGNYPVVLSVHTENWNPVGASSYISISWDYNNQTIEPNQIVPVVFTLSVSETIQGIESFSFDIVITATSVS